MSTSNTKDVLAEIEASRNHFKFLKDMWGESHTAISESPKQLPPSKPASYLASAQAASVNEGYSKSKLMMDVCLSELRQDNTTCLNEPTRPLPVCDRTKFFSLVPSTSTCAYEFTRFLFEISGETELATASDPVRSKENTFVRVQPPPRAVNDSLVWHQ